MELNFVRALTMVRKRRNYKLHVESHGVFGVAAVLMDKLKSNVHGSLTHGRIQGGGEYSPRWSLLELCRILCTR